MEQGEERERNTQRERRILVQKVLLLFDAHVCCVVSHADMHLASALTSRDDKKCRAGRQNRHYLAHLPLLLESFRRYARWSVLQKFNGLPTHPTPPACFAIACTSAIRMFLQRSRYLRGKEALRAWRTSHSLQVLQCMRHEVFRQKKIEAGLESVSNNANELHFISPHHRREGKGLFLYANVMPYLM